MSVGFTVLMHPIFKKTPKKKQPEMRREPEAIKHFLPVLILSSSIAACTSIYIHETGFKRNICGLCIPLQ